jgi:hypothetical protein
MRRELGILLILIVIGKELLVEREKVIENVHDLRRVGLPAVAVPSQYSPDSWLRDLLDLRI